MKVLIWRLWMWWSRTGVIATVVPHGLAEGDFIHFSGSGKHYRVVRVLDDHYYWCRRHWHLSMGTKSLLYGAHAFWLHPWFVAWAWWRLYGFPWDLRLWVAFIIHDWGYWGKEKMDDEEGERHPEWAAKVMGRLFDGDSNPLEGPEEIYEDLWPGPDYWHYFCLLHSRYYARKLFLPPSRLCYADKLALALEPWWLYLPRVWATGELAEYMSKRDSWTTREPVTEEERKRAWSGARGWFEGLKSYLRRWVEEHYNGDKEDRWTAGR